uniref:SMB domain-containing protein n=1 Tax=Xenopsylla cheopis TaxID=163159 RepID=A0A6M2DUC3_XENCH
MFSKIGLLLAVVLLQVTLSVAVRDYIGLPPGPYCASRYSGCCPGRQDDCSAPIIGTLCYCDDFCNRTRAEDCCPDFWSFCKNEPSPITQLSCHANGREYFSGTSYQDNCNKCTCTVNGPIAEFMCEQHVCLLDENMIDGINMDSRHLGWTGVNYTKFWGRKLEEGLNLRTGTLLPERSVMRMKPIRKIYDPNSLPKSFSTIDHFGNFIGSVVDQGWCGSSWAVSTVNVAADRLAILSKGRETVRLSAQNLLACNKRHQKGCRGGHLDVVWQYLRKNGVVDEKCYPYEASDRGCRIHRGDNLLTAQCNIPEKVLRTDLYSVGPAYRLHNDTDVMHELMVSGPVQATMKVYRDFFAYAGGIYKHSSHSGSHEYRYHSVKIVGWGEDTSSYPPVKYWTVANSWGREWGDDGYFRIVRGTNECDIESFMLAAWTRPADPIRDFDQ